MTYFDGLRGRTEAARRRCAGYLSSGGLELRAKPKFFIVDRTRNDSLLEARVADQLASYWRYGASSATSAFTEPCKEQSDYSSMLNAEIETINDDLSRRGSISRYVGFVFSVDSVRCDVERTPPCLAEKLWGDLRDLVDASDEPSMSELMEASAFAVYQAIESIAGGLAALKDCEENGFIRSAGRSVLGVRTGHGSFERNGRR